MFINPHYFSKEPQQVPKPKLGFWEQCRLATIEGNRMDSMSCYNYCKSTTDTKTQAAFDECLKTCDFLKRLSEWHRRN